MAGSLMETQENSLTAGQPLGMYTYGDSEPVCS